MLAGNEISEFHTTCQGQPGIKLGLTPKTWMVELEEHLPTSHRIFGSGSKHKPDRRKIGMASMTDRESISLSSTFFDTSY
jgi:hypothetical protein